jgi:hypothetical protein
MPGCFLFAASVFFSVHYLTGVAASCNNFSLLQGDAAFNMNDTWIESYPTLSSIAWETEADLRPFGNITTQSPMRALQPVVTRAGTAAVGMDAEDERYVRAFI